MADGNLICTCVHTGAGYKLRGMSPVLHLTVCSGRNSRLAEFAVGQHIGEPPVAKGMHILLARPTSPMPPLDFTYLYCTTTCTRVLSRNFLKGSSKFLTDISAHYLITDNLKGRKTALKGEGGGEKISPFPLKPWLCHNCFCQCSCTMSHISSQFEHRYCSEVKYLWFE